MSVATMGSMSDGLRTIRMNDDRIVVQPEARARYLVSRRLAEYADEPEVLVPLEAPDDSASDALDGMSKDELIAEAEKRDLATYGTKAQLIERITDHDRMSATSEVGANAEDEPLSESDSDGNS